MDDKDKSPGELLQERLILKPQNSGIAMSEEETGKAVAFCEPYKDFLDCAKTERRAVRHTVELLEKNGYSCQIETSGTHEVRCSHTTWVTVSPKVNMRGGYDVLSQALERADEIKHPVGRVRDIEALDELLETLVDDKPRVIALQPISQKDDATRLCIETCIARNWRLSMQTHKYLNIA